MQLATQRPSRKAGPASPVTRRPGPAGSRPGARRRDRRYDVRSPGSRRRSTPAGPAGRVAQGTPPFALVSRGMHSALPRRRSSAPRVLLLLSALAVLAFALLPGLARAEECSGGAGCVNYQTGGEVPNLETKVKTAHPQHHSSEKTSPKAHSSGAPSEGGGTSEETGGEQEEEKSAGGGATGGN